MVNHLTEEERRAIIAMGIFSDRPTQPCPECGGYHLRRSPDGHAGSACPRVKRITFLGNGNRTEIEYWHSWDESNTLYPEQVYDEEELDDA